MAVNSDPESQRGSDEQTPLLGDRRTSETEEQQQHEQQHEQTPLLEEQEPPPRDEHEEAALLEPPAPGKRTWGWWAWRAFWTILVAVILAVFIKGWIDADNTNFDLKGALMRALGGGLSGAAAMLLQVLLLMPLRTIMNYQYRHGTSFTEATRTLYHDGGIRRYYQGLLPALFQGPISRFGDTAANAGILALLQSNPYLSQLPSLIKTVFASICAACFRMILTPIDTLKTTLQAQGARGTALLRQRIKRNGVGSLWWGAIATAAATFVGHYPWFATYNFLSEVLTEPPKHPLIVWLARLAFIGFCASVISDSVSNSLRVVKTYRQVNDTKVSYSEAARLVVLQDGISGLFGRGLKTRILANGLQGLLFSILWKLFLDLWEKKTGS
ncbi:putative mitochondrial carrier protein [Eutypa lata UCREL1]|uniref:Putative mitochondrial carrier protein n=1 Tax=Eutypa lata (strain UCR-EL1) TaxID=1287681 RepID=M7SEC2_EUTLA|nr:putative mitochondrial carrier protein [Eutypa lata UCREL1]